MNITLSVADTICRMEVICWGEGLSADNEELLVWIKETYPELVEKYSYLYWPESKEDSDDSK